MSRVSFYSNFVGSVDVVIASAGVEKPGLQYLIDQTVDYIIKDRCGCFFMAPLVAKTSLWETDPTPA